MNPGEVVAERFEIERLAGRGGVGTVYRALDRITGAPVALKVLRDPGRDSADRFGREARALAELKHPRIVSYVAHGRTAAGDQWLAMEWLDGMDLSTRLAEGLPSLDEITVLVIRTSEALAAAHARGILHRDIKPSNLFLPDGDMGRVKILDFGLARRNEATQAMTRTGSILGTPAYMAPEQAKGDRELDPRVDIFALGCVMFECLSGRTPFQADHALAVLAKIVFEDAPRVRELRPAVPRPLDDLVARMLSRVVAERPTPGELASELAHLSPTDTLSMPPRPHTTSLTTRELRLVSVILAPHVDEHGTPFVADATIADDGDERNLVLHDTLMVSGAQEVTGVTVRDNTAGHSVAPNPETKRILKLREVLEGYGATLATFLDGSIVSVVTGAGSATELAMRAARCALAMRAVLVDVPIALATGRAVMEGRLPVGAVIDRAAALVRDEPMRPGRALPIRIDQVTAGLLPAQFDIGGETGLELVGERELLPGRAGQTRKFLGKATPCVGRQRELAFLSAIFDECVEEGIPRVVLVTGASGIGKSRVRYEFLNKVHAGGREVKILIGSGNPISGGSPYYMLAQAIRTATGLQEGEALADRRMKLRSAVAPHLSREDRERVTVFLGELVGTPFPDDEDVQLRAARQDPVVMGDQIRRAWEDWLAAECAAQPVILVLEDMHWGDLPTVRLVDTSLRNIRDQPLMVFALARPEVHDSFPRIWAERDVQEIRLGALRRNAAAKLVKEVLGEEVTEETLERILDRAGGNAFFLEELIRAVKDGVEGGLPDTVLAMVQSRLEGLPTDARRILRAASVFGNQFSVGGVQLLLGSGPTQEGSLDEWLVILEEHELIGKRTEAAIAGGEHGEYTFRHSIVREAAYAMLTPRDCEVGHRLAGEWLEKAGENEAIVLAEHFERGDALDRASGWYQLAAEQALEANDYTAAVARADKGMHCFEVSGGADDDILGHLWLLQAEAHRWSTGSEETVDCGAEAMAYLPKSSPAWFRAVVHHIVGGATPTTRTTRAARRAAQHERIEQLVSELHGRADDSDAWVSAAASIAAHLFLLGRQDLAQRLRDRIGDLEDKRFAGEPAVAARIHRLKAIGAQAAGRVGEAFELLERAAANFEQAGDIRNATMQRIQAGYSYFELGGYAEAESTLRAALAASERLGSEILIGYARRNLGRVLIAAGQVAEAEQLLAKSLAGYVEAGNRRAEAECRYYLALAAVHRKEWRRAELEARAALSSAPTGSGVRAATYAVMAETFFGDGRRTEGLEAAREAMGIVEDFGVEEDELYIRLVHAQARQDAGNPDAARRAIGAARTRLEERAAELTDDAWRRRFLDAVPHHREIDRLARSWVLV